MHFVFNDTSVALDEHLIEWLHTWVYLDGKRTVFNS